MNKQQPGYKSDNQQLDRILAQEDALLPSSGFASSVMDAIQSQAAEPAPIPFPWKLAIPGIAGFMMTLAIIVRLVPSALQSDEGTKILSPAQFDFFQSLWLNNQAGPIVLTLAASLVCVLLCRKLALG